MPVYVMPLVFGGAPLVNVLVSGGHASAEGSDRIRCCTWATCSPRRAPAWCCISNRDRPRTRVALNILVANFGDIDAWTIPDAAVAYLHACVPHAHIVQARTMADILAAIAETEVAFSWQIDRRGARACRGGCAGFTRPSAGIGASLLSDALRQRDDRPDQLARYQRADGGRACAVRWSSRSGVDLHTAIARQAQAQWAQNELTVPSPRVLHGRTLGLDRHWRDRDRRWRDWPAPST